MCNNLHIKQSQTFCRRRDSAQRPPVTMKTATLIICIGVVALIIVRLFLFPAADF